MILLKLQGVFDLKCEKAHIKGESDDISSLFLALLDMAKEVHMAG